IDVEFIRNVERSSPAAFADDGLGQAHIFKLACGRLQAPEILRRRFKRVNKPSRTDPTGKKLRIDADIRTYVDSDIPRGQRTSQQLMLRTISIGLKDTITEDVNGKRAIVNPIANLAKNRNQPH